uniref:CCHC-type domain-containing protein n=1 Tax=Hyaloperonospora arabidopsidis (strain Emoy2) TaxID=559515 RepID=M4BSZ7_HYAAE
MNFMRAKYEPMRFDCLHHAEELAHFVQSIELGSGEVSREVVAAHFETKPQDTRTCFRCGRTGNAVSDCKTRVVFDDGTSNTSGDMVLSHTKKASAARTKAVKSKKKNLRGPRRERKRASCAYAGASSEPQTMRLASIKAIGSSTVVQVDTSWTTSRR